MKKIKISIPLSTANLACGFDTFALALDLCNEYTFETSDEYSLVGFLEKYNNPNNMCLNAYKKTFSLLGKEEIKVKIVDKKKRKQCKISAWLRTQCSQPGAITIWVFLKTTKCRLPCGISSSRTPGHPVRAYPPADPAPHPAAAPALLYLLAAS